MILSITFQWKASFLIWNSWSISCDCPTSFSSFYGFPKEGQSRRQVGSMEGTTLFKHSFVKRKTLSFLCAVCCVTLGKLSICWWQAPGNVHGMVQSHLFFQDFFKRVNDMEKWEHRCQISSHTYNHARTTNTIPTWWLVSWDLMRPIGAELVTTITSPSSLGTHFLYLSNPPSGNLLPIIPWFYSSIFSIDCCRPHLWSRTTAR